MCDDDHPMSIAAIGPAGHKRQTLIGEVADPPGVIPSLIGGDIPLRSEKYLSYCVLILLFAHVERDQVTRLQVIQIAKHFSSDVVMA
jgi:hypothetical protein